MTVWDIETPEDLSRFIPIITIKNKIGYKVLTGFEDMEKRCFWCGEELKGRCLRYCPGHREEYWRHFEWQSASSWCLQRYHHKCAVCGTPHHIKVKRGYYTERIPLEIHHIVPLGGTERYISAFNYPSNLIALCHYCHQNAHSVLRAAIAPYRKVESHSPLQGVLI
jgi:hypothetical protein